MSESTQDVPKVSGGEATITYSGEVQQVSSDMKAKSAVKTHIERVFGVERGDIGFIDIVVSELEPHVEGSFSMRGRYKFKAEFELDEGPSSYVFEEESQYAIDAVR